MRLKEIHVKEFRCVRDSNTIKIDDVTCLVGKNESGKTAVLQALYRLNPIVAEDAYYDVTDDYPRIDAEDYEHAVESGKRDDALVANALYQLEPADKAAAEEEFGEGVFLNDSMRLERGYKTVEKDAESSMLYVSLQVDEAACVGHLIEHYGLGAPALKAIGIPSDLGELQQSLQALKKPSAQATALLEVLKSIEKDDGLSMHIYDKHLKDRVPKFLYFDDYYQMTGEVNIEALMKRRDDGQLRNSDRPMLGLIELARLDYEQLLNPEKTEWLNAKLEGTSNHLTKQTLRYWSQNKYLQMKFDVRPANPGDPAGMQDGTNLWGRVYNSRHFSTTRLGARSRGFVWFFSFLAWFSQQKRKGIPMILLLDEPGLFLHATAQSDLLRYIDKELRPNHQVIYSTHSPFMVDADRLDSVRLVEDKSMLGDEDLEPDQEGTKVTTDVLETDSETLFPLQGALGYQIHQSLFVGPNCLIVEGPSDLLYLRVMSSLLDQDGRVSLDGRWTITPVGGADKVPTFVALLGSQRSLNIATLLDLSKSTVQMIQNLYKRKLLKKNNLLTYGDFTGGKEADVEDMFEVVEYLTIVNEEYESALPKKLTKAQLKSKKPRITSKLEDHFREKPLKGAQRYNHYRPARRLSEQSGTLGAGLSSSTLDRFEAAFKAMNALLRD